MKNFILLLYLLFFFSLSLMLTDPAYVFAAETLYLKNGKTLDVSYKWKENDETIGYWEKGKKGTFYIKINEIDFIKTEQKRIAKSREEFLTPPRNP